MKDLGPVPRLYARYAAAFLLLTLLSGIWLRAAMLEPRLLGGFAFPHLLHAHSHVAFFGWTTMALFALLARAAGRRSCARLRLHAHLVGVGSAAAYAGFLFSGYAAHTIALSVFHVGLWIAFAAAVAGPLATATPLVRPFFRTALAFLLAAGAGALIPGVMMALQVDDRWLSQLSVQLFLTPFVSGWLVLGVMGAVYARLPRARFARAALFSIAIGTLPSVLVHTLAPPPAEWLTLVGRAGALLAGTGALLLAADVMRTRVVPLLHLVGAAMILKGLGDLGVATGLLLEVAGTRALAIAYLHLLLLGAVTPALMASTYPLPPAPRRVALYAVGVGVMLAALVALGWPGVMGRLAGVGIDVAHLLWLALAGGVLSAVAAMSLLAGPLLGGGRAARRRTLNRSPVVLRSGNVSYRPPAKGAAA